MRRTPFGRFFNEAFTSVRLGFHLASKTNMHYRNSLTRGLRGKKEGIFFELNYTRRYRIMVDMGIIYFTPEQVAEKLQLDVATIYRYLRSKKLRGAHISRKCWRIAASDLYIFLQGTR